MSTRHEIYTPTTRKNDTVQHEGKAYKLAFTLPRLTPKAKDLLKGVPTNSFGTDYNGYGYSSYTYRYFTSEFACRNIVELFEAKEKARPSEDEKKEKWAKRLSKLSGITIEEALTIADEKLEYKQDKIEEMEEMQAARYSVQREKLLKEMRRDNPLRRIEDASHAQAILAASDRHRNTNYDRTLQYARELAYFGEIEKDEVKAYARSNYNRK